MCSTSVNVSASMDAIFSPVSHYDLSVFPDDTNWYVQFEKQILKNTDEACVFTASDADLTSFVVLPLVQSINQFRLLTLASMENYYSVDFRPICSTPEARALIQPLLSHIVKKHSPDILRLQPLDSDAPETSHIQAALKQEGWHVVTTESHVNWVHDLQGDFDHYLQTRPGRLRSTLKRKKARLNTLGNVDISIHDGSSSINELICAYRAVYEKSWKVPEPHEDFIPSLILAMAKKGHLRLGLLSVADNPVAVHFWIVKNGCANIYKLAHDSEFDQYSPGTLLMAEMVRYVMEFDAVRRLDFLTGNDSYKRDWMSECRQKLSLTAYNPHSFKGNLLYIIDTKLRPKYQQFKRLARKLQAQ